MWSEFNLSSKKEVRIACEHGKSESKKGKGEGGTDELVLGIIVDQVRIDVAQIGPLVQAEMGKVQRTLTQVLNVVKQVRSCSFLLLIFVRLSKAGETDVPPYLLFTATYFLSCIHHGTHGSNTQLLHSSNSTAYLPADHNSNSAPILTSLLSYQRFLNVSIFVPYGNAG